MGTGERETGGEEEVEEEVREERENREVDTEWEEVRYRHGA